MRDDLIEFGDKLAARFIEMPKDSIGFLVMPECNDAFIYRFCIDLQKRFGDQLKNLVLLTSSEPDSIRFIPVTTINGEVK